VSDDLAEPMSMTSLRPARRFDWRNLGLRAVSAGVMIPVVIAAIFFDWLFLLLIAVSVALLAIEWAAMTTPRATSRVAVVVSVAVLIPLFLAYRHEFLAAAVCGALGVASAALIARGGERPVDAALGVAYIAAPCLALMWLRAMPNPISWTILLFAVTWSADICAFAVGNLLKGPKLWPRFSPNKTWSGFAGGLLGAMAAAMVVGYVSTARISPGFASVLGLAGGLATMAGDLGESMLKRRYGVKDSGDLIPGHGGLLDRVDGLLFAVLAVAAARFVHQAGWAH
jgi:phosphatidate cytidylyltransferase